MTSWLTRRIGWPIGLRPSHAGRHGERTKVGMVTSEPTPSWRTNEESVAIQETPIDSS
ncbi:MAG: hypothetical protein NTX76_01625 [Alphaproteobacteria bacterium]|nr:hypothetical protein [Alphaproteobacteria bacterium]